MNILTRMKIKQDFKSYVDTVNFICEKAEECLDPLADVYWQIFSLNEYDKTAFSTNRISSFLNILSLYINQINDLEKKAIAIYNENTDLLKRYTKLYDEMLNKIKQLHYEIVSLATSIREIKNFSDFEILNVGLTCLTQLEIQIDMLNGRQTNYVNQEQQTLNA